MKNSTPKDNERTNTAINYENDDLNKDCENDAFIYEDDDSIDDPIDYEDDDVIYEDDGFNRDYIMKLMFHYLYDRGDKIDYEDYKNSGFRDSGLLGVILDYIHRVDNNDRKKDIRNNQDDFIDTEKK